jgi:pimeloyl-ACP methyl ester carboxylesterase
MGDAKKPELLLLHALPLNGAMWAAQMDLLPGSTHAPTLCAVGAAVEDWAAAALKLIKGDRVIVVGCSVGGSCAIEVAVAAPERVAALVLIGTKAEHRPDPDLHAAALETLRASGIAKAWQAYLAPLFSAATDPQVVANGRLTALAQSPEAIAGGITAFHSRPSRIDFLSAFQRPVYVVTGADDIAPGPKTSAAQAQAARFGSFHEIAGCGHYVPLEQPETLNAILRPIIAAQESC